MGVNPHAATFLVAARAAGVHYARTATIGRQRFFLHPRALERAFARAGSELSQDEARLLLTAADGFVEPLLTRLGAQEVDSVDASPYEGSTIVHDMNQPVPAELEGAYSVVIDSGSLEHVFEFPTAIANCMRMVRVGGHVLMLSPTHGETGQGLYQFSPELFYRVFAPENGFRVEHMLFKDTRLRSPWYTVADPRDVRERVVVGGGPAAYLYVIARRERDVVPFATPPQQSDYAAMWETGETGAGAPELPRPGRGPAALLPEAWKERYDDLRSALRAQRRPALDPRFFHEVDLSRLGE